MISTSVDSHLNLPLRSRPFPLPLPLSRYLFDLRAHHSATSSSSSHLSASSPMVLSAAFLSPVFTARAFSLIFAFFSFLIRLSAISFLLLLPLSLFGDSSHRFFPCGGVDSFGEESNFHRSAPLSSSHFIVSSLSCLSSLSSFSFLSYRFPSPFVFVSSHSYKHKDHVPVLVNNVGPFHNPAESYKYYSLPYCAPKDRDGFQKGISETENLSEVLAGDRRQSSLYDIRFLIDVPWSALCHFSLRQDDVRQFRSAIKQHYIFEMFVDDLSVKGFVGEMEQSTAKYQNSHVHNDTHIYLFTHLDFSIAYNDGSVISVNLTTDPQQRIELEFDSEITVEFSYSVHWIPTHVDFAHRFQLHSASAIGEQSIEIHWLSIINSFVLVILLTIFLGLILMRVLHKDFARYMEMEEDEDGTHKSEEELDEVGWKLVHGDVFRFPSNPMLFSSCIGNGSQLFVLIVSLLLLSVLGTFYAGNRGALYSAAVFLYATTAFIAGYVSTNLYLQFGGTKWATNSLLTSSLFAIPFFITFSILNSVAWYYGSSSALPAITILSITALWALVSFPLTIFGSMRARHGGPTQSYDAPCKTNRVEREIPPPVWYRSPLLHLLIAGFLPFSAIYIELHYIFASVWGHRVYTLFGILALAFVMLIIVTAFITVALTYFQLASEDYHWWWRSFFCGCSTGVFMYVYAGFYYFYRSEMSGILQFCFFFGYMLMISYAFALMLGTCAFFCAQTFVKHIYRSIKID